MRAALPFPLPILLVLAAMGVGATLWTYARTPSPVRPVYAGIQAQTQPVRISPGRQPVVETGLVNHHGEAVSVSCMTCHATREPNLDLGLGGAVPKEFHPNLHYAHGGLSCLSCHDAGNYDALRRADGRLIAFPQASQNLCSQCHGPQTRDYAHGSHGGMRGYWDLSRGERTRNSCTDCHDPHAPAFPAVSPVFAPKDAGALQQALRDALHAHD